MLGVVAVTATLYFYDWKLLVVLFLWGTAVNYGRKKNE
jgi:hypothetical protein